MIKLVVASALAALTLQFASTRPYNDPKGRFTFSYPSTFGSTSPGTNDGFLDRVAAVAFSTFPSRFKGEAVLTRGFPLVDLQAVGGLYDSIALEIFPDPLRAAVVAQLPRLTAATFCGALERTTHLDPTLPAFASFPPAQRQAIGQVDVMRNADPRVAECRTDGETVVFDKARSFRPGDPVQHVYGAVRFLPEPYSTFQLVAGGSAPDRSLLAEMKDVVASFKAN